MRPPSYMTYGSEKIGDNQIAGEVILRFSNFRVCNFALFQFQRLLPQYRLISLKSLITEAIESSRIENG